MDASTVKGTTYYVQVVRLRWSVEVIKVSKKELTSEWEMFGGMYTFVIIMYLNLNKQGDNTLNRYSINIVRIK